MQKSSIFHGDFKSEEISGARAERAESSGNLLKMAFFRFLMHIQARAEVRARPKVFRIRILHEK